jgi:hypothetical protein
MCLALVATLPAFFLNGLLKELLSVFEALKEPSPRTGESRTRGRGYFLKALSITLMFALMIFLLDFVWGKVTNKPYPVIVPMVAILSPVVIAYLRVMLKRHESTGTSYEAGQKKVGLGGHLIRHFLFISLAISSIWSQICIERGAFLPGVALALIAFITIFLLVPRFERNIANMMPDQPKASQDLRDPNDKISGGQAS